jgi:HemK-related putative methylase
VGAPSSRSAPAGPDPPVEGVPVYPPREDTWLILPFAEVAPGTLFLEVGCGAGLAALAAARRGARVVATDVNLHALRRLRAQARAEDLDLTAVRTDLARGLGRFDRLLANPPYLPTRPEERDPDRWHNLALDGGPDGCRVTARLVEELDEHLNADGTAFVVVSSRQDTDALERIRRGWAVRGGSVEVAASRALEGERLDVWRLCWGSH